MDRLNRQLTLLSVVLLAIVAFLVLDWERSGESAQLDDDAPPSRDLFDYEAASIVKVTIQQPGVKLQFERREGAWQMVAPVSTIAQTSSVATIIDRFEDLRIDERALEGKPADYGLGESERIELRLEQVDGTAFTVYLGADSPVGYKTYALVAGDDGVHTLSSQVHDLVAKGPDDFRGRDLMAFSPPGAERVRIVQGDREVVYRHDETGWWVGDTGPRASDKALSEYLSSVSGMKVQSFLDGKTPAELGLENPAATVSVKDDSGTHTLRIGPRDESGAIAAVGDIAVRVSAADLDVLLPPETWTGTLLVEAKSWKVDALTIELAGKKLSLTRKAGAWKDAEDKDAPNASAIVDALLELAVDRAGAPTMAGDGGRVVVGLGAENVTVKIGDPDATGGRVARDEAGGPAFTIPAASLQVLDNALAGKILAQEPEADPDHMGGGEMPAGLEELLKGMGGAPPQ